MTQEAALIIGQQGQAEKQILSHDTQKAKFWVVQEALPEDAIVGHGSLLNFDAQVGQVKILFFGFGLSSAAHANAHGLADRSCQAAWRG